MDSPVSLTDYKGLEKNSRLIGLIIKNSGIKDTIFAQLYKKSKTWTLPSALVKDDHNTFTHLNTLIESADIREIQRAKIVYDSNILYSNSVLRTIIYEIMTGKDFVPHDHPKEGIEFHGFMPTTKLNQFRNRTELMLFCLEFVYKNLRK